MKNQNNNSRRSNNGGNRINTYKKDGNIRNKKDFSNILICKFDDLKIEGVSDIINDLIDNEIYSKISLPIYVENNDKKSNLCGFVNEINIDEYGNITFKTYLFDRFAQENKDNTLTIIPDVKSRPNKPVMISRFIIKV